MRLPNETLLEICKSLTRFQIDVVQLASRQFYEIGEESKPLFSLRLFVDVDCEDGIFEFKIDNSAGLKDGVHGECRYRAENLHNATRHFSYAYVQRFAISGTPPDELLRFLAAGGRTFNVGIFVLTNANLTQLTQRGFRDLLRSVPGFKELSICDSEMSQNAFTDEVLRDCASTTAYSVTSYDLGSVLVTDAGICDFFDRGLRGTDDACKLFLRQFGSWKEDGLLLKLIEHIENGSVVSSFCLSIVAQEQRLGKYRKCARLVDDQVFRWILHIEDLQLEAAWGRGHLLVNRRHDPKCLCPLNSRVLKMHSQAPNGP